MEINRRKFHRITSQGEPCCLRVDNLELPGLLVDESISGAKVADLNLLMMPYNKSLTLEHRDGTIEVRARNVERMENGTFVIGLVRTETLSAEQLQDSPAMLINCYVQYEEAFVICVPIHIESENQVLIQLVDGVQFRVPSNQLKPLTRSERFEMLSNEHCLSYTAPMYGFQSESMESDRQNIFEHEFGVYENCPVAMVAE